MKEYIGLQTEKNNELHRVSKTEKTLRLKQVPNN